MHHEAGNIPINKCINDIYGIRMITKEALQYPEIKEKIEHRYKNLKCIDSSKGDYKAIHIYFKKDNYSFHGNYKYGIKKTKGIIWNHIKNINKIIPNGRTRVREENNG